MACRLYHLRKFFVFTTFLFVTSHCLSQAGDTVFFDENWRICEKGIAEYYRLAKIEARTYLQYSGMVKDYYRDGAVEMEGNYSAEGYRDGEFSFYYPNGNLASKGRYVRNSVFGKWAYYYLSGKPRAEIYYRGPNDFSFLSYFDSTGNNLLKEGTGYFEWAVYKGGYNTVGPGKADYIFKGNFDKGDRSGHWEIYIPYKHDSLYLLFKEDYDHGKFLKGTEYAVLSYDKPYDSPAQLFTLSPPAKFNPTETFACHIAFSYNDDKSEGRRAALEYIFNKKLPAITIKCSDMEKCMNELASVLSKQSGLTRLAKEYDGDVNFNVDVNGHLSNIAIFGNITDRQSFKMKYLLSRVLLDNKKIRTGTFNNLKLTIVFFTMEYEVLTPAGKLPLLRLHYKYSFQKD